jgi:hypothetical protein
MKRVNNRNAAEDLTGRIGYPAIAPWQGLEPSDYNPLLDALTAEENSAHLARIQQQTAAALGSMARHEDYIRRQLRQS